MARGPSASGRAGGKCDSFPDRRWIPPRRAAPSATARRIRTIGSGRASASRVLPPREGVCVRGSAGLFRSRQTGDEGRMSATTGSAGPDRPAAVHPRLWEPGGPAPDVFGFLASRRGIPLTERLEVLLVDQSYRWLRGEPLPLRVYLTSFPEI